MITKVKAASGPGNYEEAFEYDPTTTTGLNFGYKAGYANIAGKPFTEIAASTVLLTDDATNYVHIHYLGTPEIDAEVV